MKTRTTWIVTGTIGILGMGTGVAFAAAPSSADDADSVHTALLEDDAHHGVTLTPDPLATTAAAPAVTSVDPAQTMPDSSITSITVVSAPSAVSALSPMSAPSPVSTPSPMSAPSAPSAD